jgi:hypothetical protein
MDRDETVIDARAAGYAMSNAHALMHTLEVDLILVN